MAAAPGDSDTNHPSVEYAIASLENACRLLEKSDVDLTARSRLESVHRRLDAAVRRAAADDVIVAPAAAGGARAAPSAIHDVEVEVAGGQPSVHEAIRGDVGRRPER